MDHFLWVYTKQKQNSKRPISGAPENRVFVSVSWSFLGRFQKFKDLDGEHVKAILMNPIVSQTLKKVCSTANVD